MLTFIWAVLAVRPIFISETVRLKKSSKQCPQNKTIKAIFPHICEYLLSEWLWLTLSYSATDKCTYFNSKKVGIKEYQENVWVVSIPIL